ncbi:MAG: ATP-binding protein, partial [Burkholderiales bacterium]
MRSSGIERRALRERVQRALRDSPVVALVGPRQCGKTTLAREIAGSRSGTYFDLEDPVSLQRLAAPKTALESLGGLIVIDEVQRRPDLFPVLRVLADAARRGRRFLILGSASPELLRQGSETLAGRIAIIDMAGFNLGEVGAAALGSLWWRGGFPRSFLARSNAASVAWRQDFIRTFLERDMLQLGVRVPPAALRRLWTMIAHWHGQIWNASEIGRSLGEAHVTVKRHLDALTGALVVRQLQPWFENLGKRQVKAPKVYVRDAGLLHTLLDLPSSAALDAHPKVGASWEGFVLEELIGLAGERNAYYWRTQAGAELDLLLLLRGRRIGVEVKYADAPAMTRSMHASIESLKLDRLYVIYPGTEAYALRTGAEVLPLPLARERVAAARDR